MASHKINSVKVILLVALAFLLFFYARSPNTGRTEWGVSFSPRQAQYLGFDWKPVYSDILLELRPKHLRLMTYWDSIEAKEGESRFADVDYLLAEAKKHGVSVILAVGRKQPRWPECHEPAWLKDQPQDLKEQKLLEFIETVVRRYQNEEAIAAWQVENEPFFQYGPDCPVHSKELLAREIELVSSLDSRPIVVTDSGEKGAWLPTARVAGAAMGQAGELIFGSTIYREVYHNRFKRYLKYPVPAFLYRVKAGIVRTFSPVQGFIGSELQAEPWFATDVYTTPWERQRELMNREIFEANIDYARRVGFDQNYLWGVEWWYYAKEKQGDDSLWLAAKKLFAE